MICLVLNLYSVSVVVIVSKHHGRRCVTDYEGAWPKNVTMTILHYQLFENNCHFSTKHRLLQGHVSPSYSTIGREKPTPKRKLPAAGQCHRKVRFRSLKTWLPLHGNPTWRLVCIRTAGSVYLCEVWSI